VKKILCVVIDGLGDRPDADLGGRTPLEAADTPFLDELAQKGETGLLDTVGPGVAPESDAAAMSILGYDVDEFHTGRGPLEAHGAGMDVPDGCLAWRGDFAAVDGDWNIVDRRSGRDLTAAEARQLAAAVREEVVLDEATFELRHATGHRACLVIQSLTQLLSGDVDNCDPAYRRRGAFSVAVENAGRRVAEAEPLRDSPAARLGAQLTNQFLRRSQAVLDRHPVNQRRREVGKLPANFILLRDAGDRLPRLPPFQLRFGIRFGSLVEMPAEIAVAWLTGMGLVAVPSTAAEPEKTLADWSARTISALADFDGVYVHVKGPDRFGHDGDPRGKAACIEAIDRLYFGPLVRALPLPDYVVAVTADHSTPCATRAHSADPVPILISNGGLEPEGALQFSEGEAARGLLGKLRGPELVPRLVEIAKS